MHASSSVAIVLLLAGCASYPDAVGYNKREISFEGEKILGIHVEGPGRLRYIVFPSDDITNLDTCLMRETDVNGWRGNTGAALDCDLQSAGADGGLVLQTGKYVLAMYCRPQDVEGQCHVEVTVSVTAPFIEPSS